MFPAHNGLPSCISQAIQQDAQTPIQVKLSALEQLRLLCQGPSPPRRALLSNMGPLLTLVTSCLTDSQLKTGLAALTTLRDLIVAVGADIKPYLGLLCATVVEKLGDSTLLARGEALCCIGAMADAAGAGAVVEAMLAGLLHLNARIREETLSAIAEVTLAHGGQSLDVQLLCGRAADLAVHDASNRVKHAAVDVLCALASVAGEQTVLHAVRGQGAPPALLQQLQSTLQEMHPAATPPLATLPISAAGTPSAGTSSSTAASTSRRQGSITDPIVQATWSVQQDAFVSLNSIAALRGGGTGPVPVKTNSLRGSVLPGGLPAVHQVPQDGAAYGQPSVPRGTGALSLGHGSTTPPTAGSPGRSPRQPSGVTLPPMGPLHPGAVSPVRSESPLPWERPPAAARQNSGHLGPSNLGSAGLPSFNERQQLTDRGMRMASLPNSFPISVQSSGSLSVSSHPGSPGPAAMPPRGAGQGSLPQTPSRGSFAAPLASSVGRVSFSAPSTPAFNQQQLPQCLPQQQVLPTPLPHPDGPWGATFDPSSPLPESAHTEAGVLPSKPMSEVAVVVQYTHVQDSASSKAATAEGRAGAGTSMGPGTAAGTCMGPGTGPTQLADGAGSMTGLYQQQQELQYTTIATEATTPMAQRSTQYARDASPAPTTTGHTDQHPQAGKVKGFYSNGMQGTDPVSAGASHVAAGGPAAPSATTNAAASALDAVLLKRPSLLRVSEGDNGVDEGAWLAQHPGRRTEGQAAVPIRDFSISSEGSSVDLSALSKGPSRLPSKDFNRRNRAATEHGHSSARTSGGYSADFEAYSEDFEADFEETEGHSTARSARRPVASARADHSDATGSVNTIEGKLQRLRAGQSANSTRAPSPTVGVPPAYDSPPRSPVGRPARAVTPTSSSGPRSPRALSPSTPEKPRVAQSSPSSVSFPGEAGMPARRAVGASRMGNMARQPEGDDPDDVMTEGGPHANPKAVLQHILAVLTAANSSSRKDLDWSAQYEALADAGRLVVHHADVIAPCVRALLLAVVPAVEELRSQTARRALRVLAALLRSQPKLMEKELDTAITHGGEVLLHCTALYLLQTCQQLALQFHQRLHLAECAVSHEANTRFVCSKVVPPVVKRAGEGGNAATTRETFLSGEADAVLYVMCAKISESRSLPALLSHAQHKAAAVRSRVAAHVAHVCCGPAGLRLPANVQLLEKVVKAGLAFSEEGSQDTRASGKRILAAVKGMLAGAEGRSISPSTWGQLLTGMPDGKQHKAILLIESLEPILPSPEPLSPQSAAAATIVPRGSFAVDRMASPARASVRQSVSGVVRTPKKGTLPAASITAAPGTPSKVAR